MAIYEFGNSFTFANVPRGNAPAGMQAATIPNPSISPYMPGTSQISHVSGGRVANTWETSRTMPEDIEGFIEPGFRYLDGAMKNYWADIRVPHKDGFRFIKTRIAGANAQKSLQIWTDDLKHGRVRLPVISISRTGQEYNVQKFTPPYAPLRKRFVNNARSMVALSYRPVPWLVNYTLSIWAEHKRDAEYILYQILTRFNPLAELRVTDDHNIGNVQMRFSGSSDSSDKEASAEQYAKIKYEVTYAAEAWLSMPEKIMPVILGSVTAIENRNFNNITRPSKFTLSGIDEGDL